jgi:signal transduction histidine kinase
MIANRPFYILLTSFLFLTASFSYSIDDKSGNQVLLAAEKTKIEILLEKAAVYSSAKSDSGILYARQAYNLALAKNEYSYQIRALDIITSKLYDNERYSEVIPDIERLIYLHKLSGDSLKRAYALNLYGLACYNTGIYDEAIKAFHHCRRLAEEQKDDYLLALCFQNTGVLYAELKHPEDAMEYYKLALDLYRIKKDKNGEASIMQNIGIILSDRKKYREALGYYLSALKVYEELKDNIAVAMIYLNLGSSYEEQNDYTRALSYYIKALNMSVAEEYKYGIAYSHISLGMVYKLKGEFSTALEHLKKSLKYSRIISLVENEIDCHYELSEVYFRLGNYETAYNELKAYKILYDSLYSEHIQQDVAEVEMRFKSEMKDKEIENLIRERQETIRDMIRRTIGLFAIVLLTLIIIAVSIYYSRTLKKANSMLTEEINERKRAEAELISIKENLEERVVQRTKELEKSKIRAEESDRLKSAFIANMSHEIRTPLNAITGFSGLLLREDISPEKRKEFNQHVVKNNKILVNMIEDLIDTSKIESGNLQLHPSLINLKQFLYRLNEPIIENMARKNKPYIDVVMDPVYTHVDAVIADPVRLQQVIWHVLDNAVKFTREGSIHYGCREENDNMVFYVSDTGIGIPDEQKEVVFEKFRQIDESAKRKYGGTGLGLYYARKIAEMMGGKLWFESKGEGGTIFFFSIPMITKPAASNA